MLVNEAYIKEFVQTAERLREMGQNILDSEEDWSITLSIGPDLVSRRAIFDFNVKVQVTKSFESTKV